MASANLVLLVSLVLLVPKETWDHQETRVASVFKVLVEKPASLEWLESLEKWALQVRMDLMEKREDQEIQEHQDRQASLVLGVSQA